MTPPTANALAPQLAAETHAVPAQGRSRQGRGHELVLAPGGLQHQVALPHRSRVPEAQPFLKWVGGKRALLPQISGRYPRHFGRYFEPFVGGGAVFFDLQPQSGVLSDLNEELVIAYRVVQNEVEALIRHLQGHRNDEDYYYELRAQDPEHLEEVERASRLLFLNRTCFNGLYRVNAKGRFNVPFGKYKNPTICNPRSLRAASEALQGVELHHRGYEAIVEEARKGDFIYFDPPYHPRTATSDFTSYTAAGFSAQDQAKLAEAFTTLDRKGCKVMLSNSDTPLIQELYEAFHIDIVAAPRLVNRDATKRGPVDEVLVRNYR
jgi:DNA adenine methylase